MEAQDSSWILFAGSSHPELAQKLSHVLETSLGGITIETFPDGEIGIQVLEHVRGKDVVILQSIARNPNLYFMELLILVDALKRASARSIIVALPYYGYARQDRKDRGRVPITARLVADLLEKAGVTRVLTMDLHTDQIQGFFNIPVDNLYARPLFIQAIQDLKILSQDLVVVSPDMGSNRMARKFAEDLEVDLAIVNKRRLGPNRTLSQGLIGNVSGKIALLVDDICSTGSTLIGASRVCREEGAKQVLAFLSHALFVEEATALLNSTDIDHVYITDSIPSNILTQHPKVSVLSIAPLFGEAIERLLAAQSISSLFTR